MYVCVWESAEPEDNSRSEKRSELFEERSKWMLLARQVRLLLYVHAYIHTYTASLLARVSGFCRSCRSIVTSFSATESRATSAPSWWSTARSSD